MNIIIFAILYLLIAFIVGFSCMYYDRAKKGYYDEDISYGALGFFWPITLFIFMIFGVSSLCKIISVMIIELMLIRKEDKNAFEKEKL